MAVSAGVTLVRVVLAVVAAAALAGCATRFDHKGNQVYMWQEGRGSQNAIDYSDPRLPQLPRTRMLEELWQVPSPYEFNDLSRYSLHVVPALQTRGSTVVGDNAGCAAPCNPTLPGALVVSRADVRVVGRSSSSR